MSVSDAMHRAIALAQIGEGQTGANPIVGAVILDAAGQILAEGFHTGGDHAEVVAIKSLEKVPEGATIVVTLEPCNHTGRTGPCTQAIIDAQFERVIYAVSDPNPIAAGGRATLEAAGIEVIAGVLEEEARFINRAWLSVIEKQRPLFIWKVAATLDGKTAAADGSSKWITGQEAREYVSWLRRKSDAILVGTGTALADDPALVPHDGQDQKNPLRVVVGNRDIPEGHQLRDSLAEFLHVKSHDPVVLIAGLLEKNVKKVLVEAGSELGTALLRAGLIDEIILIQAPTILGSGRSFVGDLGIETIADGLALTVLDQSQLGNDFMMHMKVGK